MTLGGCVAVGSCGRRVGYKLRGGRVCRWSLGCLRVYIVRLEEAPFEGWEGEWGRLLKEAIQCLLVFRECLLHYRDSGVVGGEYPLMRVSVRGGGRGVEQA